MRFASLAFCLIAALPTQAHEFWISPDAYQVPTGGTLSAEFRVGQEFKGGGYVFVPGRSEQFFVASPAGKTEVTPRVGDRPALNVPAPEEGLNVAVHETSDLTVTYKDIEVFKRFLAHKDWAFLEEVHRQRGLPDAGFKEAYRRYAKALIGVGHGEGADVEVGLDLELVAVLNPYADNLGAGMLVDLYHYGAKLGNTQVEVFDKAPDGSVEVFQLKTTRGGRVRFDVTPGHEYLVDSVIVQSTQNDDVDAGPVWRSLWASLTFRVPE